MQDIPTILIYICSAGKLWGGVSILYFAFGLFLALGRVEMPVLVFFLAVLFTLVGVGNLACVRRLASLRQEGRQLALWTGVSALFLYAVFLYPILPADDVRMVAGSEIFGSLMYELIILLVLINRSIREVFEG